MASSAIVYVNYRYSVEDVRGRLLDLTYIDGRPVAVVSWIMLNGKPRAADKYVVLDPKRLRASVDQGVFWYDGVVDD